MGLLDLLRQAGGGTEGESVDALQQAGNNPLLQAFIRLQAQRAKDAVTAPRDAYTGALQVFDPETGHTTPEAADRAAGMAGIAMTGGLGGAAVKAGETALGSGPIRAYHGSPHDFDKFSLSKIGTGEGAQAYGHGLYFAENEGVARSYRDVLSAKNNTMQTRAVLDRFRGDGKAAAEWARSQAPSGTPLAAHYDQLAQKLETGAPLSGRMYEVGIDADPAKMLNYDAPLGGQSRGVREYGGGLLDQMQAQGLMRGDDLKSLSGADLPYMTKRLGISPAQVSDDLKSLGVPGTRFLDAGSRHSADKTSNYVTFSDDIVSILRKYGIAGLALLGAGGKGATNLGMGPQQETQ